MFDWWFRIKFWKRVVGGFVLGALAGWLLGPDAEKWFGPLGDLYVTLIKMIAVPLVFFAVINAVASLSGQKSIAALAGQPLSGGHRRLRGRRGQARTPVRRSPTGRRRG